jgi:hypothetical protein
MKNRSYSRMTNPGGLLFVRLFKRIFATMRILKLIYILLLSLPALLFAQFPPAAGQPGSTAIPADSPLFKGWATDCRIERGLQDLSNPGLGYAEVGLEADACGPADGISVVSLGDSGTATLTFDRPIRDGEGWDFAVFENGFSAEFLELAFVEVSSDGVNFVRFPSLSLTSTQQQIGPFGLLDTEKIDQLAGKYEALWGTPFDLQTLEGNALLNLNAVTHVRISDVVGSVHPDFGRPDSRGSLINDPWPTPFPSSGFDLDAVGVIHPAFPAGEALTVFPNPLSQGHPLNLAFQAPYTSLNIHIFDTAGRLIYNLSFSGTTSFLEITLPVERFLPGSYFIQVENDQLSETRQLILLP